VKDDSFIKKKWIGENQYVGELEMLLSMRRLKGIYTELHPIMDHARGRSMSTWMHACVMSMTIWW
jgi:hypothetical protein